MRRHLRGRQVLQALSAPKHQRNLGQNLPSSIMPSKLTLRMLLAATLAALQLSASAAPLEEARTNCTADVEGSGEEQREEWVETRNQSLNGSPIWDPAIALTKRNKEEFDKEFQGTEEYNLLEKHKHPSFPGTCLSSNYKKESCLQKLAEGLLTYMVLLKHVEKEYPNSSTVTGAKKFGSDLIQMIKSTMRSSKRVKVMSSCEEQQLLKELDHPDAFTRKMRAHSILSYLHYFLIDSKRSFCKYKTLRNQAACGNATN